MCITYKKNSVSNYEQMMLLKISIVLKLLCYCVLNINICFVIAAEINGRLLDETQENMDLEVPPTNVKEFPAVPQNSIQTQTHPR